MRHALYIRLLTAFFLLLTPQIAQAEYEQPTIAWEVLPSENQLTFEVAYENDTIKGGFKHFEPVILFSPYTMSHNQVFVTIFTNSAYSGDKERDKMLTEADWFDISNFPNAQFIARKFEIVSETEFVAEGTLRIKNITLPVTLPFTFEITSEDDIRPRTAIAKGETTLKRLQFRLGTKEFSATDSLKNDVRVSFSLRLQETDPKTLKNHE